MFLNCHWALRHIAFNFKLKIDSKNKQQVCLYLPKINIGVISVLLALQCIATECITWFEDTALRIDLRTVFTKEG